MQNNLGRYVKWQDEQGGWHTGREVLEPPKTDYSRHNQGGQGKTVMTGGLTPRALIAESCDGALAWVELRLLQDWPMRSEWEPGYEKQLEQARENYLRDATQRLMAAGGSSV